MAVKKATTTEDLTASAESASPTLAEQVERNVEATAPEALAKVDAPKVVKVKSPFGAVTEVPEGIVDALLESGYSKTK